MANPRVLCFGEALFDRFIPSGDPMVAGIEYPGGAPLNVACQLAKLGIDVGWVGALGQDERGDRLDQLLQGLGVDTVGVQRLAAPTRVVEVIAQGGDRVFGGFGGGEPDSFADARVSAEALPRSLFETAEVLVLGTIPMAYGESARALQQILAWVDEYYLKVVLDVNWRPKFWPDTTSAAQRIRDLLPKVDFLKLADEEAEWLFGTTSAAVILEEWGETLEGVLVTHGAQGCSYAMGELKGEVPSFVVPRIDTTGAGDSFVAGFVHHLVRQGLTALSQSEPLVEALSYANAMAAMTCMGPGAIAPQPKTAELEAFLVGRVV